MRLQRELAGGCTCTFAGWSQGVPLPFATAFRGTHAAAEVLPIPWWWLALHPPGKVPIVGWQVVIRGPPYMSVEACLVTQPHVFKKLMGAALIPSFLLTCPVISVEQ